MPLFVKEEKGIAHAARRIVESLKPISRHLAARRIDDILGGIAQNAVELHHGGLLGHHSAQFLDRYVASIIVKLKVGHLAGQCGHKIVVGEGHKCVFACKPNLILHVAMCHIHAPHYIDRVAHTGV